MAFDEAKFRANAKAAGYSDDEINAELNTSTVANASPATPPGSSAPPAEQTFSDATAKAKADYDAKVHKALTSEVKVGDTTYEIPSFFTSPAGILTAAGAGIGLGSTLMGAANVAPKMYNAIKDRWISKAPAIDRTVDIPFEGPTATLNAKAAPVAEAPVPKGWEDILAKSNANAAAKAADAAAKANPLPVGSTPSVPGSINPMNQLTAQPAAYPLIQKPVVGSMPDGAPATPVTPAPVSPTIAQPPVVAPNAIAQPPVAPAVPQAPQLPQETLQQAVQTGGDVGQALKVDVAGMVDQAGGVAPPAELRTGTGKIAYAGQGPEPTIGKKGPQFRNEYQSLEAVPKGYAFVPNAQYADPLRNDLGQAEYTKAFTGREFPTTYDEAIATGKDINRSLGRATREEAKAAGLPKAETTEGIFKKTTENKKLVKIIGKAGLAGALVSLADLALAKTPEQKSNAGLNLLGAILPPGMEINAAGAPGVNQSQVSNAYLLGSPYAQTEAAKAYRLRERAGAGQGQRGIAPPSAYQR